MRENDRNIDLLVAIVRTLYSKGDVTDHVTVLCAEAARISKTEFRYLRQALLVAEREHGSNPDHAETLKELRHELEAIIDERFPGELDVSALPQDVEDERTEMVE